MKPYWQVQKPDDQSIEKLYDGLNCHPVIAAILANRNILSPEDASNFLNPSLTHIRPPFVMKDMDKAVDRIISAISNKEKILIFGDYDVDGITATSILIDFLQYAGAGVSYYIPHRILEGYGLQPENINHAIQNDINLIITVDCGSSSHSAVISAQNNGIDVIITDHHHIGNEIPNAFAVINPKRLDCTSGLENLAGVGVAFCLIISIRKKLRDINFWKDKPEPNLKNFLDAVAIGTIADMVPLIYENRILAKIGLEIINSNPRCGIKALIETSSLKNETITATDVAFKIAPRLNAAGRIDHAAQAVTLLTTRDPQLAAKIANSLTKFNALRQEIEKEIVDEIFKYLDNNPNLLKKKSIVLSNDKWNEGVIGIIASRVMERYYKPVILISTKGEIGKGSGRSIDNFNIYEGLNECREYLDAFGGHSKACGLKIKKEKLNNFIEKFENVVIEKTSNSDFIKIIPIDYELDFNKISDELIDELELLMPFGSGNPEPIFMARNVQVSSSSIVGKNHRKMLLTQDKKNIFINAIHFNVNQSSISDNFDKIAFKLNWNRWNGKKTAQIVIYLDK
ncbi:MAG: single-stranded-DNA-specific exonuclease RecJ [Desulfobacterales bacterium]|nr:single-stranded-DNA-specific exonuclease RecJ [Desulfobacterales bacterium]MBF0395868.1 single-stranded-DNA-specific exonuclease RecJ [Desulfobacterales bacterium]